MKTPIKGPIEDQLKHLFTAVAESAPIAPEVSDIARGSGPLVAPTVEHHRPVRWIASAAAIAVALAGGLVWSIRGDSQDDAGQSQAIEPRPRLHTFLVPTVLPDGWQLVDIAEFSAAIDVNPVHRWLVTGRDDLRAVLSVYGPRGAGSETIDTQDPSGTIDATETTSAAGPETYLAGVAAAPEDGFWSPGTLGGNGSISWQESSFNVSLTINSDDEGQARALRAALQPSRVGDVLTYSVDPASSYRVAQDLGVANPDLSSSASLQYIDRDGMSIQISLIETPISYQKLLDPDRDDSVAVAIVVPGSSGSVSGIVTRSNVLAGFGSMSGSHHTPAEARSVLDSLVVVPESAWDDAVADIASRISAEPTIGAGSALGGQLSIHDGDLLDGICFAAAGTSTCRSQPPNVVGPDSGEFVSADLLVGDRWINVTRLPEGPSTDPIQIERMTGSAGFNCASEQPGPEPDCGRGIVDRTIVRTDAGTFVVLSSPPGVATLTVSVGNVDNRALAEQQFIRPLR